MDKDDLIKAGGGIQFVDFNNNTIGYDDPEPDNIKHDLTVLHRPFKNNEDTENQGDKNVLISRTNSDENIIDDDNTNENSEHESEPNLQSSTGSSEKINEDLGERKSVQSIKNTTSSHEEIHESSSMFVRISNTSVDMERVQAFEKLTRKSPAENSVKQEIQITYQDNEYITRRKGRSSTPAAVVVENDVQLPIMQNNSSLTNNKNRKSSKSPAGPSGPSPKKDPYTQAKEVLTANDRARAKSPLHPKHLFSVEVEERKLTTQKVEQSPYLCRIIELPPEKSIPNPKNKLFVCQRDQRLLNDTLAAKNHQIHLQLQDELTLFALHQLHTQQQHQDSTNHLTTNNHPQLSPSPSIMSSSVPLKLWPNFDHFINKAVETETQTNERVGFEEGGFQTNNSQLDISTSSTTPKPEDQSSKSLEHLAGNLESGIYGAHEACGVLLQTIFKPSLGNPASLEKVLESTEFQDFLVSPNEIQALDKVSVLLQSTTNSITDYLKAIKETGVSFPSKTSFPTRSSQVISLSSIKSLQTCVKSKKVSTSAVNVWSFVPPTSPEKFQLSLFYNPESGEIMQTITAQDHIFRTRYTTSSIQSHKIRNVISANREQVGLPAFINPESLLDTISRCSSYAASRLTSAKMWTLKCSKKMYTISSNISKSKFSVEKTKYRKLNDLTVTLQQLNVFAGIIYQLSTEMVRACKNIQSAVWNTMYVQDVLKFPRIPGFPNPKLNKECQIPSGTKIPIHEAMKQLTEGLRNIDYAIRTGVFSAEALRFGVRIPYRYKKFLQEFLQGIQTLGGDKDVDYGSLLMTLLCSTEMINHFQDLIPTTDVFVRAAILTHLGKINWGTAELLGAFKRMEADSHLLTIRTIAKMKQIRDRKNSGEEDSSFWNC